MTDLDYEKARKRVEKRMKKRQDFYVHIVLYVAVNLFLWCIWFLSDATSFPWPLFVMGGWGIALVVDAVETYFESSAKLQERREQAIQRELERERALKAGDVVLEKPKRTARLAEDGELVYDDETAEAEDEPIRRESHRDS
jgi:hypothetical protein